MEETPLGKLQEKVAVAAKNMALRPEDVAEAVLDAVTQPETVHLNEIMVRSAQQFQPPGMNLPA